MNLRGLLSAKLLEELVLKRGVSPPTHVVHAAAATHKSLEPVSSTTFNACGLRRDQFRDKRQRILRACGEVGTATYGVPICTVPR